MSHLDSLNPFQREAATHQDGPLLIIAGAGAGKTKTITHRILHLIEQGVAPERILAITFTNKAAKEMRDRVTKLLGRPENSGNPYANTRGIPFLSTFHSLGVYILRNHGQALGLSRYFSIYDKDEQLAKVKTALRALSMDEKVHEPKKIAAIISKMKGNGKTLSLFTETASQEWNGKNTASVWAKYEQILAEEKALDFDDLLLKTSELFTRHPDILNLYQDRWQYIHIDEYQDTNTVQYDLTTLLAKKHHNLCVVGDIDQSIYSWRGADYENILNFEKDYPGAKVVLLEENYRSTQNILTAANDIIKKNKKRREKNLFTKNGAGEKITIYSGFSEADEARFVAEESFNLIRRGVPASEIAVLYRANFQSRALEEQFLRSGVPYQVLGTRFFDRKEVKDLLAFIKLALNPQDKESLKRVINIPPRGIGGITLEKIFAGQEETLPPKMQEKIRSFRNLLARIKQKSEATKPSELIRYIVEETGIGGKLETGDEEEQERLENLKEFASLAVRYDEKGEDGLLELVSDASLVSDQDSLDDPEKGKKNGVKLMTVHASKGLEFRAVFVTGLEQNLFPHAGMGRDEKRDDEEERRLFYVAVTRAKEKLYLCYAQMRTIFGARQMTLPSEFLDDIDMSLVETPETGAGDRGAGGTTSYIDF
ncbi:MAG: UvrD-helicase domain-containing protein [Candidatus Vogelbacteria bacterium]|nr:UvrD-helicase domain-containing protein [Candidatus Vogelbacteria bacterium]